MYYLYYLIDPNTNLIRYVGISYHPDRRLSEHIHVSSKLKTHKDRWIHNLLIKNQKPIMKIVHESQDKDEILAYEIEHISMYDNLTNLTSGGEYFHFTPEVIEKLKRINTGSNNPCYKRVWSKDEKQKLSSMRKGRILNKNWKTKIGLSAPRRQELIINGVTYTSIKEAMRVLKIGFRKAQKFVTK